MRLNEEKIKKITEPQYHLFCSTLRQFFNTVDEEKLNYLKKVANNTIEHSDLTHYQSEILSRILRDISTEEVKFLAKHIHYEAILIGEKRTQTKPSVSGNGPSASMVITFTSVRNEEEIDGVLRLSFENDKVYLVRGLMNLGLLALGKSKLEYKGFIGEYFIFTSAANILINLLKNDD